MMQAGLHHRLREGAVDRLRKTRQAVDGGGQELHCHAPFGITHIGSPGLRRPSQEIDNLRPEHFCAWITHALWDGIAP